MPAQSQATAMDNSINNCVSMPHPIPNPLKAINPMKTWLSFFLLIIASAAQAADPGYLVRADCGALTPVTNGTVCLQTTTASGRTAGVLYVYTGSWVTAGSTPDPLIIPSKATPATAAGSLTRDTDNGILFMGDGTNAKCPEEKSLTVLIDKCYGVKNDVTTDDTVAWQSMLTTLQSTGGTIIKTGNSKITTMLTYEGALQKNLRIVGMGVDPTFTWAGALGGTIFGSVSDADKAYVHFEGIRWHSASDGVRAGKAIHLRSMQSSSVIRNKFDNVTDAIYLQGVLLSRFDFNRFDDVKQDAISMHSGGLTENNGNWITRNEFSACGRYCVNAASEVGNNGNVIQMNDFEGQFVGTSLASIYAAMTRGVIAFNRFEDGTQVGADFRSIIIPGTNFLTIMGNDFGEGGGANADYWIDVTINPVTSNPAAEVKLIGNMFANTAAVGNIHMLQTTGAGFYSIGDSHNRSVPIVGDTANLWTVIAGDGGKFFSHSSMKLLQHNSSENLTTLPVWELNSKHFAVKGNNAAPVLGTFRKGDFVYTTLDSGASPTTIGDTPLMYWAVTAGTMGTLVGETGGITINTTTLTMTAPSALAVGDMITIAGVSGIKTITVKTSTTVFTIDSNADATVAGAAVAYSAAVWEPIYPVFRATPASAGATGSVGMQAIDANYHYWYTGSTWKRAPNIWGLTASKCVETDSSGNLVSAADVCGSGGSGLTHPQVMGRISIGF